MISELSNLKTKKNLIPQIAGGLIFLLALWAFIDYLRQEEGKFAYLWACDIVGMLLSLALLIGKKEIVLTFAIWTIFPLVELLGDFQNIISKPEYPILIDNIALVFAISFLIKEKFLNLKFILTGVTSFLTYTTLTNLLTGGEVNYPPEIPKTYPLWSSIFAIFLLFLSLFLKTKKIYIWLTLIVISLLLVILILTL